LVRYLALFALLFATVAFTQESSTTPGNAKAPEPVSTVPVLPDSTKLEVIKTVRAAYPFEAVRNQMQGQVRLKILISESGDVESADVIEGDEVFRQSAIDAVKKWKYKPYIRGGKPVRVSTTVNMDFLFSGKAEDKKESAKDASDKSSDPNVPKRVRVSQGVSEGMLIHKVQPTYPPDARTTHVQGMVVLRVVIGKDGRIQDLSVLSGPPELRQSAMGAVRQWRYKPYSLMGEPVEVDTQITVNYQLH
jgi:TonB family protein